MNVMAMHDSLALCEKLVVAAAVCNEYEVLNEALDTLIGRAQVGGLLPLCAGTNRGWSLRRKCFGATERCVCRLMFQQGRSGWNPGYATFSTVLNAYRRGKDVSRYARHHHQISVFEKIVPMSFDWCRAQRLRVYHLTGLWAAVSCAG